MATYQPTMGGSGMQTGQDCCVAKDKSPIEIQADAIAHLVGNLNDSIKKLESRLSPMMVQLPENPNKESCGVSPMQSVFVEFLKQQAYGIDRAISSLNKIHDRLEV